MQEPIYSAEEIRAALAGYDKQLAATYPYAFRLGLWLSERNPHWPPMLRERGLMHERPLPLPQAEGFLLLACLEHEAQTDHALAAELAEQIATFFCTAAEPAWVLELFNTIDWYSRERDPGRLPSPQEAPAAA